MTVLIVLACIALVILILVWIGALAFLIPFFGSFREIFKD